MKARRITVIIIAIAFFIAVLSICYFMFNVKKVDVKYSVSNEYDITDIDATLQKFEGENLLFLDESQVYSALEGYYNVKVLGVKKNYPNVLEVELRERITVFNLYYSEKTYSLDEEGVVLKITDGQVSESRDVISLELDGIAVNSLEAGGVINTSDNQLVMSAIEMAKSVNLTDCIKKVSLNELKKDAEFITYTGVSITVTKANERGVEKIEEAFDKYDKADIDYVKSHSRILVTLMDSGEMSVVWES